MPGEETQASTPSTAPALADDTDAQNNASDDEDTSASEGEDEHLLETVAAPFDLALSLSPRVVAAMERGLALFAPDLAPRYGTGKTQTLLASLDDPVQPDLLSFFAFSLTRILYPRILSILGLPISGMGKHVERVGLGLATIIGYSLDHFLLSFSQGG